MLQVHPKFLPLFEPWGENRRAKRYEGVKYSGDDKKINTRYYVFHGGRFGLKSWACADALVTLGDSVKLTILCAREIQNSLSESVHSLLCNSIEKLKMSHRWDITKEFIRNTATGTKIFFRGLHNNKENIKSLEAIDICWVEEAQSVSKETWEYLDPTIRKPNSEIWVTFNPDDELDPTYVRYISNPRDNSLVVYTSFHDAEDAGWLPESVKSTIEQCKRESPKEYRKYWLGEPTGDYADAIIQPEWVEAALDAHIKLGWEPLGQRIASFDPADTGDDKAVCVRHGFLIEHLSNWTNLEIPEAIQRAYREAFEGMAEQLVFDADGLGAAMKVNLEMNEKEYRLSASGFKGGMTPDDPDCPYPPYEYGKPIPDRIVTNKQTFRNKRAQYYWFLKDRFERTYNAVTKNQWVDPDSCISISSNIPSDVYKQLRRELTRVRRKKGQNSSLITLESKADMKAAGIKSPGLADAVMMSFANPDAFGGKINLKMKPIC